METINAANVEKLASHREGWLVSIYLPTHPASPEGQQDPVRLKNLLTKTEDLLVTRGMHATDARRMLRPARQLLESPEFWKNRSQGLALFLGEKTTEYFRVPIRFREELQVDHRYHIKQLLPLISATGPVYVLAISRNRTRLLSATAHGYSTVELPGLPQGMDAALNLQGADRGAQVHAATHSGTEAGQGKQAGVFHGHGGHGETLKEEIEQYFRMIDAALRPLRKSPQPLIVAGVEYEQSIFRKVCTYPQLVESGLSGNFDHTSDYELYQQALPLVRQLLQKPQRAAVQRFQEFAHTTKTTDELLPVLVAAHRGQIETLFVDSQAEMVGHFDPQTESFDLDQTAKAEDLPDRAAVETLMSGGTVFALSPNDMPNGRPIAAVFRY